MEDETNLSLFDDNLDFETFESDAVSSVRDITSESSDDALEKKSVLASFVEDKFNKAEVKRRVDEQRWLEADYNYRGLYSPTVRFRDDEKSRVFIKVTKTKVLAAFGQIADVLFGSNKFPLSVEPTILPDGITETAHINLDPAINSLPEANKALERKNHQGFRYKGTKEEVSSELVNNPNFGWLKEFIEPIEDRIVEGPGTTEKTITFHPAMVAAKKMEKKIHDQLDETHANKHLRSAAFEMALYGHGVLKGPFLEDKEYPRWDVQEPETESEEDPTLTKDVSTYNPLIKTVPKIEYVSVWNYYPDPDADNQDQCEFVIERCKMSAHELRKLKNRPFFRKNVIEQLINDGPNYTQLWWETTLESEENYQTPDRWEVLVYWGYVDKEILKSWDIALPKELKDAEELNCNIWVSGGKILRVVVNPFKPSRIPYFSCPYEHNPYSFFGIGVAENMSDTQALMNGFMRLSVDNAVLSGNLVFEVDKTNLEPGADLNIYPGKVFVREGGAPGQSIFATSFPNVSRENMEMFDVARRLSDESTGLPSYSHGQTGNQELGRTASGLSMLMGAANGAVKAVIKNVDDFILAPLGKSLFSFNMQFDPDPSIKGDLEVKARGTESLMANEVRSQRLMQFMGITVSNPMTAPFAKIDYIIREIAKSLDLDPDKVTNSMVDAAVQAEILKKFGPPQQDPAFLQQQAQADQQGKQQLMQAKATGQGSPRQDGSLPVQQAPGTPTPTRQVAGTQASDPTGAGGGNIGTGSIPSPGSPGFSGNR